MTSDDTRARDPSAESLAETPSPGGEVMDAHQQSVRRREEAVRAREKSVELREQAVGAGEGALQTASDIDRLNAQLREANEQLVVATVQAQTAEEHAEEASHLKDDFLATVSHELRTPLNAVLGWARMLIAKQLTPEREAHALDTIERNAASLAHIIDDLLDVSRIIAGRLQMSLQPVDIATLSQAAVDVVKPLAGQKRIDLRFSAGPDGPALVSGDGERLQQVIWNLLTNAVKFTGEGGRVDVSIAAVGSMVELRVADTGQGISPDFLPHIFERFRQADGAPSRRHGGLGLGLAIARQLVEMHGGSVRAVSEGVGRGATFTVRLPILGSDAAAEREAMLRDRRSARSPGSPSPRVQRLDNLRILVVDDHDDSRTLTTLLLTQTGATVDAVATAREALQRVEVQRPDVLVSDIGLPDEDGYSLIRQIRLRQTEHGGAVPAIALTGYARADDRDRALAAGFQAHIAKPVDFAELLATIADVAGRSKS
jgi:signal transduction histidine kinase/ActR/RegA family two-component response regulator